MRPSSRRSTFGPAAGQQEAGSTRRYHDGPLPSPDFPFDSIPPRTPDNDSTHEPSPVSAAPPILPPIPRVASRLESHREFDGNDDRQTWEWIHPYEQRRPSQRPRTTTSISTVNNDGYKNSMIEEAMREDQHKTTETARPQRPSISPKQSRYMPHHQSPPQNATYESMRSYSEPHIFSRPTAMPPDISAIPQPQWQPPPPPLFHPPSQSPALPPSRPPSQPLLQPPSLKVTQPEILGTNTNTVRHGKTKLNLLNPLSLLAKRRSSQAVAEASSEKYSQYKNPLPPGMRLPDDYDPRIRGKVVHDFSAPRPGNKPNQKQDTAGLVAYKRSPNSSLSVGEDDSPSSTEKDHTPVFKEHFGDDIEPWKAGQNIPTKRRTSAFLYQVSLTNPQPDSDTSALPPFARNLPSSLSSNPTTARQASSPPPRKAPSPPRVPLEVVAEADDRGPPIVQKLPSSSPPKSPPVVRPRSTSDSDPSFQPAGLPKHLKSNASRFSFDLAGVGSSAQEKLLEEKHRQKARQKARASHTPDRSNSNYLGIENDGLEDYDDYDGMDDGGGFEEPIPGINAEADSIGNPVSIHTLDGFEFISPTKSSFTGRASPISTELTSPDTPRDTQGQVIGFAYTNPSPDLGVDRSFTDVQRSFEHGNGPPQDAALGITGSGIHSHSLQAVPEKNLSVPFQHQDYEDDDLYFDDGMIDDLNNTEGEAFDESVFDDETSRVYGLPLRYLKPLGPSNDASAEGRLHPVQEFHQQEMRQEGEPPPTAPLRIPNIDFSNLESRNSVIDLPQTSRPAFSQIAGLTQDNLSAYHDALAFAANQAALNGQFARRPSDLDSSPGIVPGDSRTGGEIDGLPGGNAVEETDNFDYDDALADDPIIAAANAEALENDDDGFYGQEFGFFARAADSGEAQYANGGYFGPRGIEGLGRSRSGRANFQEPSLTPITERSEWSNRNSAIGLAMQGYTSQGMSTPGLAQLTDMMHIDEANDMSLSALMKLRRGAWGGSNASLQSSSSGSPLTFLPPTVPATVPHQTNSASPIDGRNSFAASSHSLASSQNLGSDDSEASPSSPTITLATAPEGLVMAAPFMQTERSHSPVKRSTVVPTKAGHSRNSSGAESVSYVKEMSEDGGRWVLEKRRMVEGQVEILGREIVEGGRI